MGLKPYTISQNCRRIAKITGFDVTHADRRYPVEKITLQNIHLQKTLTDPRCEALLKARHGKDRNRNQGRGHD